jgi:sugar-specific transcriptional regulator TrmB
VRLNYELHSVEESADFLPKRAFACGRMVGSDERLVNQLRRFGLTGYEVKAFLALLEIGEGTAKEVAEAAGVPKSRIYEVINSLIEKGWAVAERGRPTRYRPQDPEVAVRGNLMRLERELDELAKSLIDELTPMFKGAGKEEVPELVIVRGEQDLWRRVKSTIAKARSSLAVALPVIPEEVADTLLPVASIMRERGGSVRVLVGNEVSESDVRMLSELAEVRRRELSFGGGVIADASEVVLILLEPDKPRPKVGIHSAHSMLTMLAQTYFDMLWSISQPVS